ncbi:tripartite tricarboxylate transporter substrate binding protein [Desulfovibrio sp. OttesenSCG-928-G11]|nr:tripartite tricarboxylate transporter substrate binding protein [Desulfovibrio sp. OttesenSCG-928-G11]
MRPVFSILPLLLLLALPAFAPPCLAGSYPEKAVEYLIVFNAGGESDIFARAQQPLLEKHLGQSVVLSYKAGGGGAAGWADLAGARPDGYLTAGFNLPHIILQPLQREDAGYATSDIRPVMIFMSTPCVLAVPLNSPHDSLESFLRAAAAEGQAPTLGGSAANSANHLAVERLNAMTGLNIAYMPFSGSGDAMPAFFGGSVSGLMTYTTMGVQYAKSMRVLAVASEERFPALPDVPTFRELGYDLVEGAYRGLAVPPGTPADVTQSLYLALARVNADPAFAARMTALGFQLENLDPEQSEAFIEARSRLYAKLLDALAKSRRE